MGHVYLSSVWTPVVMSFLIASSFLCSHGQPDSDGFINIDCGYTNGPEYTDQNTGLTYVTDVGFTDAGLVHAVDTGNLQKNLAQRYSTVRFFPSESGTRSCYKLRSLTPGGKNILRAAFGYGNYDALNRLLAFDLYLGVNYWTTVNITDASRAYIFETIAVSPDEYLHVCLVNIGLGTPFISALDLRPLPANLYPEANVTQSLVLLSYFRDNVEFGCNRYRFGTDYGLIRSRVDRYDRARSRDDDLYDRIWQGYEHNPNWTDIPNKVNGTVQNSPSDTYNAPSAVMRSASTPVNASRMDLSWSSDTSMNVGVGTKYFVVLYFAEVEAIRDNALRQFDVNVDDTTLASAFSPQNMLSTVFSGTVQGSGQHNISLLATQASKLPPSISAMEIYLVRPLNESSTNSSDANAMMAIQANYSVKRNWVGDPCAPAAFTWDGLNCSYTPSRSPSITALNLSFSRLIGEIDASFGQLALLQHLDLSHNNLSGSIPDILGQMPSLTFLDLSSNNFSGTVPTSLQEKSDSGVVILKTGNNPNLCRGHTCQKKKKTKLDVILGPVGATIALLLVALPVLVIWNRRRKRQDVPHAAHPFRNQRFKYKDLKAITNGFKEVIGKGGYGRVYIGYLKGRTVAVKVESQTSSQGNNEFLAEVHHLTTVHHKNLVSLIGYCEDTVHRCLVYEYMDGGNLEDRLRGQEDPRMEPLTWLQRLDIALGSASGLEYLHKSCSPPLIHRDVKTGNILLNAKLEAKISDFGLTRAFSSETETHTSTVPAGTPGYLDPEYYITSRLSEKSDVYSFGVVLLVLITAQPAIIQINNSERENIVYWVRERLSEGDIGRVTDQRIREDCDVNSVWKVAELALHCTELLGRDRPTMTEVVDGLKESLQLETLRVPSVGVLEAEQIG